MDLHLVGIAISRAFGIRPVAEQSTTAHSVSPEDQGKETNLGTLVISRFETTISKAVQLIPAKFVSSLADIATNKSWYTAETWAFWFMFIAPIVLHGRFKRDKYYHHLLLLVKIMHRAMQFKITLGELEELQDWIIDWVITYER